MLEPIAVATNATFVMFISANPRQLESGRLSECIDARQLRPVSKAKAPLVLFYSMALCRRESWYVLFPRSTTMLFDERAILLIIKAKSAPDPVLDHSMLGNRRPVPSSMLQTLRIVVESTHTRIRLGPKAWTVKMVRSKTGSVPTRARAGTNSPLHFDFSTRMMTVRESVPG